MEIQTALAPIGNSVVAIWGVFGVLLFGLGGVVVWILKVHSAVVGSKDSDLARKDAEIARLDARLEAKNARLDAARTEYESLWDKYTARTHEHPGQPRDAVSPGGEPHEH